MDLNLCAKIDGVETTQKIGSQFDIPVNKFANLVHLFGTFRANTMTELNFRVITKVGFNLIPISIIIKNFFTICTYG